MSLTSLAPFTHTFSAMLKSREEVSATACFTVSGRGPEYLLALTPWEDLEPVEDRIRSEVIAHAEAAVSRWALQFGSADDALDDSAYSSLTRCLSAISSPRFLTDSVVVRKLVPVSARVPISTPDPIEPSFTERALEPIMQAIPALKALKALDEKLQETEGELYNDPFLGGLTTTHVDRHGLVSKRHGKLRLMLEGITVGILTPRGRR